MFKKLAKKVLSKNLALNTMVYSIKFELNHRQDFSNLDNDEKTILSQIKKYGYYVIPDFFDEEYCKNCILDIDDMLKNKKEFIREDSAFDYRIFGAEYLSENIKQFADNEFFNKLANAYNSKPTTNAFTLAARIEARDQEFGSGGSWHRDSFLRQFKSTVYLNDVDESNGPFQLLINSHKLSHTIEDEKTANMDSMESRFDVETVNKLVNKKPDRLKTFTGKAGTVIFVDTSCIHRGSPLKKGVRYALTNYFFERNQITPHLIEHFSPLVSPKKVLEKYQN